MKYWEKGKRVVQLSRPTVSTQNYVLGVFLVVLIGVYIYNSVRYRCKHGDEWGCRSSESVVEKCGSEPEILSGSDCERFIDYETCICQECQICLKSNMSKVACSKSERVRLEECKLFNAT